MSPDLKSGKPSAPSDPAAGDPDEEAVRAGDAVERLLAEPTVRQRLDRLRATWYDQWAKEDDAAKRQVLWVKSRVLADVENELRKVVSDGQMARIQVSKRAKS